MSFPFDLMTPLLLVALGGLLSERAGMLNIALEGQMLGGAFAAILVLHLTGNIGLALAAVGAFGALSSLLLAWATLRLKADPFIAALGLNLLIPALTSWISLSIFANQGVIRLNESLSPQWAGVPLTFILALILAAVVHLVLFHTQRGLQLRAAGSSEALLVSRGLKPAPVQAAALVASGVFAAAGGAVLALNLGAWVQGISAGKGWIALVALYLGFRRPLPLVAACLVLAWTEQASGALQVLEDLPHGLLLGLPSLVTVIVFVVTSAARRPLQAGGRSRLKRPNLPVRNSDNKL